MIWKQNLRRAFIVLLVLTMTCQVVFFSANLDDAKATEGEQTAILDGEATSLLDGILNLVGEKGAKIVKSNLPTVGDFLCAQVFDSLGIDYTDSYTKELKAVNKKLEQIHDDLKDVLANQAKQISQNTILEFYNTLDVFSKTVYPIYAGYNTLMTKEHDNSLNEAQAKEEEKKFYDNNLKNILFGSSTSTGDLYLQLNTLLDKIVTPNVSVPTTTLMEHYNVTYRYLWAFDTHSFAPKKEFLGYVSATVLEGLTLYAFQNAYETTLAEADNNEPQKEILKTRWSIIKTASDKALDYLKSEIKALETTIQSRNDTESILHYSSGKLLSKKLYLGRVYDLFIHESYGNISRQGNVRNCTVYGFNNEGFVNTIVSEYKTYASLFRKGSGYKISDYLKDSGFVCDNWNNEGLYKKQRMTHEGVKVTNEYWNFFVQYTDMNGNSQESKWSRLRYKVLGSPTTDRYNSCLNDYYMAFVDSNGYMIGNYDTIYREIGNTVVDSIHSLVNPSGKNRKFADDTHKKVW